ncbi:nucleotidyltransferase family protein [Tenacibaculum sp. Bg11-29]|uniref:nucleotidyltransferase family protein n=1 Tax=Tenacibaculum sp. Bg11-29 TaxID=2058306 RepID=UPI0012FF5498|nr:nucleotidyltransferase family protein [Tenacibaculum sp. Bg11-29]
MNYKETLFFVGKCLTLTHEKHNRDIVELELKSNNINWDNVVKLSTAHYVFPALYCNLKRANFLHYLPEDLVGYMKHITGLNRERNEQIIKEAKELNELLLSNNITPIFLKGTGNLLEGLYEDIAERMTGDIDILFEQEDCITAFRILQENGYTNKVSELYNDHRHLPAITHPKKIAAIEVHKQMLRIEKSPYFNYDSVKKTLQIINNTTFLSFDNQIKLTVYSKFINDNAYLIKNLSFRAAYDVFLLDKKLESKTVIKDIKLSKELNAGLELYNTILSTFKNIEFKSTKASKLYLKKYLKNLDNGLNKRAKTNFIKHYVFYKERIRIILKAFYKKSYLKFIFSKLTDYNWYRKKIGF